MAQREDISEIIYKETEKRLALMESEDYKFPPKAGRKDCIAIIATILLCTILIVCCIMGVIE